MAKQKLSVVQLQVATDAWLASLRRSWVRMYPDRDDCPVPAKENMPPQLLSIYMRALRDAIEATDPENVARIQLEQG